jgi:hypothetical protein
VPAHGRQNRNAQRQARSRNSRTDETPAGKDNSRPDQNSGARPRNRRSAGGRQPAAQQDKEPAEEGTVLRETIERVSAILNGDGDVPSRIQLAEALTDNALRLMREHERLETRRQIFRILTIGVVLAGFLTAIAVVVPDPLNKIFMLGSGALAGVGAFLARSLSRLGRSARERGQRSGGDDFWSRAAEAMTGESDG